MDKTDIYQSKLSENQDIKWWNNTKIYLKEIEKKRDCLNQANYWPMLCEFIKQNEGFSQHGYQDCETGYSIGYGLLFKRNDSHQYEKMALKIFHDALNIDLYKFIPIDMFYPRDNNIQNAQNHIKNILKQYTLTKSECDDLLSCTLKFNEGNLKKKISKFDQLSCNMQISIHSLWYNGPALLGPKLLKGLQGYIDGAVFNLLDCLYEIEHNSNPKVGNKYYRGIQNRRLKESFMFSNRALDFCYRIEQPFFQLFLNELQKDMPEFYDELVKHSNQTTETSFEKCVKKAVLFGEICPKKLPNLSYIASKMKKLHTQ